MPVHVVTEADHHKWVKGEWPEDFERVCTGVFLAFNPDGRSSEYCLTAVRSDDLRSQGVVIKWCKIQQCTKKPESDRQPRCDIWSCYTLHALAHLKDAGEGGESRWKASHTFSWRFYQDLFVLWHWRHFKGFCRKSTCRKSVYCLESTADIGLFLSL